MSRPAVESTLFRARRRLTEEYDELASGQRCLRIQSIIADRRRAAASARATRAAWRATSPTASRAAARRSPPASTTRCVARRPLRERAVEKVAALFPFPLLLRGRRGGAGDGWSSQLPMLSDHAAAGGAKLAAVAAIVVAGLGAGVGTQVGPARRRAGRPPGAGRSSASTPRAVSSATAPDLRRRRGRARRAPSARGRRRARPPRRARGDRVGTTAGSGRRGAAPRRRRRGRAGAGGGSATPARRTGAPAAPRPSTARHAVGARTPRPRRRPRRRGADRAARRCSCPPVTRAAERRSTRPAPSLPTVRRRPTVDERHGRRPADGRRASREPVEGADRRRQLAVTATRHGAGTLAPCPIAQDAFVASLMDTHLYSIGRVLRDSNPELVDDVVAQAEAIERAGPGALRRARGDRARGRLPDARDRPGRPLLPRRQRPTGLS